MSSSKQVELKDVSEYSKEKIDILEINISNYVSTENLVPDIGGKVFSNGLPSIGKVTKYCKGDILISNIRPYFKKIWQAYNDGGSSNDVLVLKAKENIDDKFLYYNLARSEFFDYVMSGAKGTKMPRGDKNHILAYRINLPPLPEQKAIAHILSTLDEKIEVNNQIKKTLENIAQTIFKQWFVDFEFPNGAGEPYKSSGGEMVESELGMIPKGWEVKKMKDILKTLEAGNRPKGGAGNLTQGVPSIGAENIIGLGQYDYSKEKYVTEEYFNKMNKGIVKSGDVLLYKDGAQLGRKTLFMDGFPHEKCCINSHVFILRTNEYITQLYLYFWIDQDWVTQSIINLNANSAQPGINQSKLNTIKILVPEINIIKRFDDIISALMKKLFLNCNENKKNQELRDSLLPKLMSGEIRVPIEEN